MTEPKFTPGPWFREPKSDGLATAWTGSKAIAAHDPDTGGTTLIAHTTRGFPEEESEANARLLAAAPELYEMLRAASALAACCAAEDCYSRQELVELGRAQLKQFEAVLAKARGEMS